MGRGVLLRLLSLSLWKNVISRGLSSFQKHHQPFETTSHKDVIKDDTITRIKSPIASIYRDKPSSQFLNPIVCAAAGLVNGYQLNHRGQSKRIESNLIFYFPFNFL